MLVKCDYLTLNIYSIDKFVEKYGDKLDVYESRFKCEQVVNHFVHGAQCLTFRWSGKVIDKLAQSFFDIVRELTESQNYTCSRIDFCLDFDATIDYVVLDRQNQETAGQTGRFGNEKSGRTISAGTRGYKLVRLYEKGKEQKVSNRKWQRLEVEFSQHLARFWLERYLNCEYDIEHLTATVIDSIKQTMPIADTVLLLAESYSECIPLPQKTYADKFMRHISLCAKALSEEPAMAVDIARRLSDAELIAVISSISNEVLRRSRDLDDRVLFSEECASSLRKILDASLFEKREYLGQIAKEYRAMVDCLANEV